MNRPKTLSRAVARSLAAGCLAFSAAFPALGMGAIADVRIHDRSAGHELPVHWHQGRAYVVGRPGNEYQVSIRNTAGEDLLAVVSVDGVNVVSGETAATHQGGYVLSRRDSVEIRGWRKSLAHTAAFYFTPLGDSYAARTGRPDNAGVVGVALFRRMHETPPQVFTPEPLGSAFPSEPSAGAPWRRNEPYTEKRSSRDGAPSAAEDRAARSPGLAERDQRNDAPLGTGHGRHERSQVRMVDFRRASERPAETIAIHYDSYRNLVARGILASPVAPRDPRPFPGFVPDPLAGGPFAGPMPGA